MANTITLSNIRPRFSAPSDELMSGVKVNRNKFQAWLCIYGKNTFIGSFTSNLDAGVAWLEAKVKRDESYAVEFKENLDMDICKLKRYKSEQARMSN